MRKIFGLILSIVAVICPMIITGCTVGRSGEDIKNLYTIIKNNHTDIDTGDNDIFDDGYTINISYIDRIENITLATADTSNAKNLYTLSNLYNPMFRAIFRYYENWNESFFNNIDKVPTGKLGGLYAKLNSLNLSLIDLSDAKQILEDAVVLNGVDNVSSHYITSYIYLLNNVVEDSIEFVQYFRELHMSHIFRDDTLSSNAVSRTIDEMNLTIARIIYLDNIRPFNLQNGEYKICDLSALVKAYNSGNKYAKLNMLSKLNKELSDAMVNALTENNDPTRTGQATKYMHYSDILRQDILALDKIYQDIDYYKLSLYRFGLIEGGVDNYYIGLSYMDKLSYEFLDNLLDFMDNTYMPSYANIV